MRSIMLIACVLASIVAIGCGPSKYMSKQESWSGLYGYEDLAIDSSTYEVSYSGDATLKPTIVDRYALFRCAELTKQKGFDYFIIVDKDRSTKTRVLTLPGSTSESHTIEHDIDPETGRRIPVAVSTSTYHPGQRSEFKEQTVTKVIRMFKGTRPAGDLGAYDAKSMIEMMGPTIPRSEDTTH